MTMEVVLNRLDHVRKSGDGWTARCPGPNHKHADRNPSLSVKQGDKGILLHCHAGCDVEQICSAVGWQVSDLFAASNCNNGNHRHDDAKTSAPKTPPQTASAFEGTDKTIEELQLGLVRSAECQRYIESRGINLKVAGELKWGFRHSWPFVDEGKAIHKSALAIPHYVAGNLVGIKFRTTDGTKLFSQIPGSSLDGLYGRSLLDESRPDVLIVEGPDDCALAYTYGFNALAINAASVKPSREDILILRNFKQIFLVGDQDIPGRKAMDTWQHPLPAEQVIRVRMAKYKDIGEMWKADPKRFKENLHRVLRFAQGSREYFDLADLLDENEVSQVVDVGTYVVDPLVPRHAISMFFGEEKGGKSLLTRYLGKCVANGMQVFDKYATAKTPVLCLDLENNANDIRLFAEHFSRIGSEKIRYRTRATGVPALDSPALLRFCERYQPLIIVDSLTKFLNGTDPFHPGEMSIFFDKLLNLCNAGATVIVIHHATRADAERYADSHQIGANVARAFAVISEDRPRLHRVRLEGQLWRGGEPVSENLIAFPVIAEHGKFGLSDSADPYASEVDALVDFVEKQPGRECLREVIKNRKGKSHAKNLEILEVALDRKKLVKNGKKISSPNAGTFQSEFLTSPSAGTSGDA